MINHLIIGTGPASVSAGRALIAMGIKPTYLDAGILTDGRVVTAANRGGSSAKLAEPETSGYKTWFGSDEPYRQSASSHIRYSDKVKVRASNSIGGFSRIWGATFEFFSFSEWAAIFRPSAQDMDAITNMVRPSQVGIDLPIDGISASLIEMRGSYLTNLRAARLSINTEKQADSKCNLCKLCLEGCPKDSIWFSGKELQNQIDAGQADLLTGHYVFNIQKVDGKFKVSARKNTDILEIIAEKVYLGAGVIETGSILLQSNLIDDVEIKDNATIFSAGFSLRGSKAHAQDFSLSKVWLDFGKIIKMSGQIYSPSESNLSRLEAKLPSFFRGNKLLAGINSRLIPMISYADQGSSGSLSLSKSGDRIIVDIKSVAITKRISRELGRLTLPLLKRAFYFLGFCQILEPLGSDTTSGARFLWESKQITWGSSKTSPICTLSTQAYFQHLKPGALPQALWQVPTE